VLFTELRFLLFFLLVFGLHWALRDNRSRKLLLLGASYAFYAAWDHRFLSLILASTALDFLVGARLPRTRSPGVRRLLLSLSLVGNLGLLGVFKYFNFFAESAAALLESLGLGAGPSTLEIVLPVGISFYTFQSLSYTIDIYRGTLTPCRNPLDFALFVGFFPQLVAGPIVRALQFLPQLEQPRRWAQVDLRHALVLFLLGWIKKACVADNVAVVADAVFADPQAFTVGARWLGASLYTAQIYCDFSGYTDMAIAAAGLLGYRLPPNFRSPYLAGSIHEFWRRWHLSLSTWFRDYLYIPLGGNRKGLARTYAHLGLVFFLCGLWHGASWSFVAWGLFHGFFLIIERRGLRDALLRLPRALRHAYALLVVLVGWVLFRAADLGTALEYLGGLGTGSGSSAIDGATFWWCLLLALALAQLGLEGERWRSPVEAMPDWLFALLFGAAVAVALPWAAMSYQPFIYFQF
jgi:alginate O-acetyltransferase complex protein AlgI